MRFCSTHTLKNDCIRKHLNHIRITNVECDPCYQLNIFGLNHRTAIIKTFTNFFHDIQQDALMVSFDYQNK